MKTILSSDTMDIPDDVKIRVKAKVIEVEGPRGKLSRNFKHLNLDFQLITDDATGKKKLKVDAWFGSRKTTASIRTALSHVTNLINGVTKGYRYKMRFVYAHFPINASITNNGTAIEIRNFLGEKKVRKVDMLARSEAKSCCCRWYIFKDSLSGVSLQNIIVLQEEARERKCLKTMSHNGKLMPNLDEKSTKVLNLTVLQRIDPFVEEILITAAHVTFYEFNIDTSQWSRKDVEGSLFVVKRNTQPRFQFIVMNRRNTDNLVENLLGDFEYEVQVPYLLYRNASQEVNGIWFYNARECEEVANLFSRILNAYSKVPTKSKVSPTKSEFEELEAVPTATVMDGPLEPSSSTASNVADVPDDRSFVNFFSTAMNIGSSSNVAISAQPYRPSTTGVSAHPQNITPPTLLSAQKPALLSTSTPIMSTHENPESNTVSKRSTDLVKPSSFFGPPPSSSSLSMPPVICSSVPTAPPLNLPGNLQRPYGAPLLQPFPPPTPPPSLTPTSTGIPNHWPVINKEKVREALQMLVQDNQFIDMVYQAVLNAHES